MKRCAMCQIEKPLDLFSRIKGKPISYCRECRRYYARERQRRLYVPTGRKAGNPSDTEMTDTQRLARMTKLLSVCDDPKQVLIELRKSSKPYRRNNRERCQAITFKSKK
jgi:hypothetical protein